MVVGSVQATSESVLARVSSILGFYARPHASPNLSRRWRSGV